MKKLLICTTALSSLAMASALREFDLYWLEEPVFPPEDHAGLACVRREGGIHIAAGENAISAMDFRALFNANAVDYAQPSATKIASTAKGPPQMSGNAHRPFFGSAFFGSSFIEPSPSGLG